VRAKRPGSAVACWLSPGVPDFFRHYLCIYTHIHQENHHEKPTRRPSRHRDPPAFDLAPRDRRRAALQRSNDPLLHQTARALEDSGQQISNLWLFPTADPNTVFARYNLTSNAEATPGATTEHLAVLTVEGDRIVESRELSSSHGDLVSSDSPKLHWTALIGTGDAARASQTQPNTVSRNDPNTDTTSSSHNAAPSLHWTARIGTGTAATSTTTVRDTKQGQTSGARPVVAAAHWTSRIGTGHAVDSTTPVM
jgi:hypothetical protein